MARYFHAHKVLTEKCRGHMKCMRCCPTEAIRVRNGKAVISEVLCVDCGQCITVCPERAIIAIVDPVAEVMDFKYKVVIPSPVLYSQFEPDTHPYIIHLALKQLGFDEVVDGNRSAPAIARCLAKYLDSYTGRLPLISSNCPSIVRLIQVKYPDLVELIVPLNEPNEVTASEVRQEIHRRTGYDTDDIGILYLASCPAKIVSIKQPAEMTRSNLDGAVSITDAYAVLHSRVTAIKEEFDESQVPDDFFFDSGWGKTGSFSYAAKMDNWLAVSGIDHVKTILDDIENSRLRNIDFVELRAHMLGCIGGPFLLENPYLARANAIKLKERYEKHFELNEEEVERGYQAGRYSLAKPILPRPLKYFDTDLATSIKRMKEIERIHAKLEQIDCGCCGCPTCLAFAEDVAKREARLTDCIFFSRSGVRRGGQPDVEGK